MRSFKPSDYQSALNHKDFILQVKSSAKNTQNTIALDVLFVGAGPASLCGAIQLANLAKTNKQDIQIGVVEKAEQLGGHSLSGAVVNPLVFKWLFPAMSVDKLPLRKKIVRESFYYLIKNRAFPLPVLPMMKNKNNYTASLCEIVCFLAEEAKNLGVHVFTSFPVNKLLMDGNTVVGVESKAYGVNKDGSKEKGAEEPVRVFAKIVVLAEGSRGHLTQSYFLRENIKSRYPQTYALGVKELWEVGVESKGIFHTLGYPLSKSRTFGGSFFYPMGNGLAAIGLVAGLDSPSGVLSLHDELQKVKSHPLFHSYLKGGKCLEWGAKTIPEGGYYALPSRLHGDGILVLGDSAGMVNMASLKGIHYAMASGFFAAGVMWKAFKQQDFSSLVLKEYDEKIKSSFIGKDLYICRNFRQSFTGGSLWKGMFKVGLISFTRGVFQKDFKEQNRLFSDSECVKHVSLDSFMNEKNVQNSFYQNKTSAVYLSGNHTRDKIPSHLIVSKNITKTIGQFYEKLCPAGVFEQKESLKVNASNCIDCKAIDVLGPRWTPRERGSGPNYKQM